MFRFSVLLYESKKKYAKRVRKLFKTDCEPHIERNELENEIYPIIRITAEDSPYNFDDDIFF